MIPDRWRIYKIYELNHYITSGSRGWAEYYSDTGDLFIRITNLTRKTLSLDLSNSKFVKIPESNKEGKRSRLMAGDILVSATADVGIIGFIENEINKSAYINQHIILLRINENKIYNKFVAYQMSSELGYKQFISLNDAGAKSGLNLDSIRRFSVPIPPLPEQRKIAEILNTWDKAIALLEQLITAKCKLKQGLMQQLLMGKKRFKEFEDSEWAEHQLSEIATITMGTSPKSEAYNNEKKGLPLLQGNADILNRYSSPRIWTIEVTKECYPNDILMSVRAPVGTIAISLHHACIGRGLASIRAKQNKVIQTYLYQLLLFFEPRWAKLSQGSTFDSVNSTDIKSCIFKISSLIEEQQKIASILSTADTEISNLEKQLAAYKQQKRGLMQQLLTGKKRVKIDEPQMQKI